MALHCYPQGSREWPEQQRDREVRNHQQDRQSSDRKVWPGGSQGNDQHYDEHEFSNGEIDHHCTEEVAVFTLEMQATCWTVLKLGKPVLEEFATAAA